MLNINTHQLRVFLEAVETSNFTQAAQRLQISQPSVSQHIQALEEHFGMPLFVRMGRSLELTDAGMSLVPLAREMILLATNMEETMASLKGDVHGHLTVACSTPTGRYILPKLLSTFHLQFPSVRATCQVVYQAEAIQLLADGKVHLALATNPPFTPELEWQPFTVEQIVLIAHPDHPWCAVSEMSVSELRDADFILPEEGSDLYRSIQCALADSNLFLQNLRNVVSLDTPEAIALAVQENLGVGFVPQIVVNRLVAHQVKTIRIHNLNLKQDVCVGRNTHRASSVAQTAFWNLLCDPNQVFMQSLLTPFKEGQS